jgi:integrase
MSKLIDALTDVKIRNVKSATKPIKLFDGRGLFLLITPNGGKWWRYKYRYGRKAKSISLGIYPEVSLKAARDRRDDARRLLASGIDPSTERKAAKQAQIDAARLADDTFEAVSLEWFNKYNNCWAESHAHTVIQRLRRDLLPWLGQRRISDITSSDLLAVLRRVESRGTHETAHRLLQILGQIYRYAVASDRADRNPAIDLRGALTPVKEKHHAALTRPSDVAGLVRAIQAYQGTFVVRCALRLAALLFVRPGELRRMEWNEIDFDRALWTIPAEKMKMRADHLVPLAPQAVAVLRELRPLTGNGRYIHPSARTITRPMSENAILAALRRMGFGKEEMSGHGFRSTASTILHENGWPSDVIELQLAHVSHRNGVRAAYDRSERLAERRELMCWWANYLDQLADRVVLIDSADEQSASIISRPRMSSYSSNPRM